MLITGGEILITGSLVIRLHHVISSPFFKPNSKFICAGSLTNFAHRLDLYRSGVIADVGSCWIMLDGGDVETGISEGGIIRLVDRPVLPLVICFVAVGLCVGDDEEDLVDRANDREPVMLKGGRMRERERGPRPPFQGHSCLLKYHLDLEKINIFF